jgi:hypothetical protein
MEMGRYCKAYLAKQFREYPEWTEAAENARPVSDETEGEEENDSPRTLTDDSILYLHENFVVADGIFMDENIIFDAVTDRWKAFCQEKLDFSVPDFDLPVPQTEEPAHT